MKFFTEFLDQHALRWSFFYPISFVIGIAIYLQLSFEPSWMVIVLLAFIIVTLRSLFTVQQFVLVGCIMSVCLCCLFGGALAKLKTHTVASPKIIEKMGPVSVEGRLEEILGGNNGNRLKIRVGAITGLPRSDTPHFVRVTQRQPTKLLPGREMKCLVFLSPPPKPQIANDFNFERLAYFQKIGGVGFVLGECTPLGTANLNKESYLQEFKTRIDSIRRKISKYIVETLGDKSGGIATAIITGDRSFLKEEDQETLRSVGLAHLLAISGLHMGLAASVFYFLARIIITSVEGIALRVPAQKASAVCAFLGATIYLFLSGGSVATQRAYIMAVVALLAVILDRPAFSLRTLAVAFVLVALLQPETVLSPGFQMSFAATAALISVYENRRFFRTSRPVSKVWVAVWSLFVTSVTASIATAPFAAYHFQQIAPLSIPANLIVMPVVSLWAAPSAALALVLTPFGLHEPFLHSFGLSLDVILKLSRSLQEYSPPVDAFYLSNESFILIAVAIVSGVVLKSSYKLVSLGIFGIGVLLAFKSYEPILYSTSSSVYLKKEDGWLKINFEQISSTNMSPMTLKGSIIGEENFTKESTSMFLQNSEFVLKVTADSCDLRDVRQNTIAYVFIKSRYSEECIDIFAAGRFRRFEILERNGRFKVKTNAQKKRPWTD